MSKWILTTDNDVINLDYFWHVFITDCPTGYYILGENKNGEEVCLSKVFENEHDCRSYLFELFDKDLGV